MLDTHDDSDDDQGSGGWSLEPLMDTEVFVQADFYKAPVSTLSPTSSHVLLNQRLAAAGGTATEKTPAVRENLLPSLYQDLQISLRKVPNVDPVLRRLTADTHDIAHLQKLFVELAALNRKELTDPQKLAVEKCKLNVMRIAQYDLGESPIPEESQKKTWLKKGLVSVLILAGLGFSAAESFTGATDLFAGLLKLSEPISFAIATSFAALSTLLFVALEAKGFMIETGISSPFSITRTVKDAKKQLDVAKSLNAALRVPNENLMQHDQLTRYQAHVGLNNLIQRDIELKNQMLTRGTTRSKKALTILKRFFSFSGASLFACAGVVVGKDLVANIALLSFGVALSNPVALAIIITLAISGFVLFYALQHRGVFDLFDSLAGRPKELLVEQNDYISEIENTNKNIATNIRKIELEQQAKVQQEKTPQLENSVAANDAVNSVATTQQLTESSTTEYGRKYSASSSTFFNGITEGESAEPVVNGHSLALTVQRL